MAGCAGSDREIRLVERADGWWTARDLDLGVTAQGRTTESTLEALDAVVVAIEGEGGHAPTDDELRVLGVDPEVARSQADELPDVLR